MRSVGEKLEAAVGQPHILIVAICAAASHSDRIALERLDQAAAGRSAASASSAKGKAQAVTGRHSQLFGNGSTMDGVIRRGREPVYNLGLGLEAPA